MKSFSECDLGIGIEGGVLSVALSRPVIMDLTACVIFDGNEFYVGLSSAYEVPPVAAHLIINDGMDMNAAFHKAGLTVDPVIGASDGAVGVVTGGRVNRLELTKQAIRMALARVERPAIFRC